MATIDVNNECWNNSYKSGAWKYNVSIQLKKGNRINRKALS